MIGASTAYYLSKRGLDVTVIEAAGVANAASGKAAGFLALDWCAGSPLDALARRSFELHARLAREIGRESGDDWGWRPMSFGGFLLAGGGSSHHNRPHLPWLGRAVVISGRLGTLQTA